MDKSKFIKESLQESANLKKQILEKCEQDILRAIELLVSAFKNGKKLLLVGIGGNTLQSNLKQM